MFTTVTAILLMLIHLHGINSQDHGMCTTKEKRRGLIDQRLAALGCGNYTCLWRRQKIGLSANLPATSCAEILRYRTNSPSGYYWLRSTGGSAAYAYCNMTLNCKGVSGGWMQVVKLDMRNSNHQCPPGTTLRTDLSRRLCGVGARQDGEYCSSTDFNTYGIEYSQVCGKIIGYQDRSPDAFDQAQMPVSIDGGYVEGISLTHGNNPRKHIWTFAAALDEVQAGRNICPCTNRNYAATQPPSFVGNDYFCDTGSEGLWQPILYVDDPLWDGAGCGPSNDCCDLNNPPWFRKQLSLATADDIEMRFCHSPSPADEDTPVEIIEIYVR